MRIDWKLPESRKGIGGSIDKLIGPGATKAEKNLQLILPLLAALIVVSCGLYQNWDWTIGQYIVVALLTIDMVGGIITNATSTAKRWFFREGQGFKEHISFISLHFLQLCLVSWLFLDLNIFWIVVTGGFMLICSIIILSTTLYLQRPVAMTLYSISIILSMYVFEAPEHLEWFLPFFYLKLFVCHCVREEPYRPDNES